MLQSPCALEPVCHTHRAHAPWNLRPTTRERKTRMPQLERSLRAVMKSLRAAMKTLRGATKTQHGQK